MSNLHPPLPADEQPSSAPVPSHTRQRSRSLTRDFPPLPSSPSPPSPLSPPISSSSPTSPLKALMRQVEFYFSNANLWKDFFLLNEMTKDANQFVPLSLVLTFKKVARLSPDLPMLVAAMKQSTKLQLSADELSIRRIQPLPPYDQLKDAHRSLYVEHLPPQSTLKSVKKMFSIFGKVTYVLRADQISSASQLNASPRLSPLIAPSSPGGLMPRLSLSASQPISSSLTVPSGTASDAVDGVFTSAFVQFEKPQSMELAVEMIHSQQKAHSERKKLVGSPAVARRSLELRPTGSPQLSSRALGGSRESPIPHINDVIILTPQVKRGSSLSSSSPPLIALPSSLAGEGPIPALDLQRPTTPNTPNSSEGAVIDPSAPLPAVFLTVTVQPKGEYIQGLEEKAEKAGEAAADLQKLKEKEKKKENNWRSATLTPSTPPTSNGQHEEAKEAERELSQDPILLKMKEDALRKQRAEEAEKEKLRELEKKDRREHLAERNQERAIAKEQHKQLEKAQSELTDNIIHISPRPSPRPSPVMRPAPTPILISNSPVLTFTPGSHHSPLPPSLSLSPSLPPPSHLDVKQPRFSLTKRTSVVAANVASHFALGPDAPDSKGFNGRGRGKILPLTMGAGGGVPLHPPVGPPALH